MEDRITLWNLEKEWKWRDKKGCLPEKRQKKQYQSSHSENLNLVNQGELIGPNKTLGINSNLKSYDSFQENSLDCNNVPRNITVNLVPFFDMGFAWNSPDNPNTSVLPHFLSSFGVGFILEESVSSNQQPSWAIRVDYAVPLTSNQTSTNGIKDIGLYFSFRHRF
jgi:outer membrane protein assembly factor BamA